MSDRPVFFVVERAAGREQAALYYDEPPTRYLGIKAAQNGLIYIVRMDTLPNATTWLKMSLSELYEAFCKARDGKTLPDTYVAPALPKTAPAVRLPGERRQVSPRPWAGRPAQPLPTLAELDELAARRAAQ